MRRDLATSSHTQAVDCLGDWQKNLPGKALGFVGLFGRHPDGASTRLMSEWTTTPCLLPDSLSLEDTLQKELFLCPGTIPISGRLATLEVPPILFM